jgi:hypothetical protein
LLAFELVQAGVVPGVILRLVKEQWDARLRAIFMKAERAIAHDEPDGDDVILLLALSLLIDEGSLGINETTIAKLGQMATFALKGDSLPPARVLMVNLSAQLRRFHEIFRVLHMQPDELFEMAAQAKKKPRKAPKT